MMNAIQTGQPQRAVDAAPAPAAVFARLAGLCRVLIVEDSLVVQRMLQLQLHKLGFEADAAGGGAAALEAMARVSYGLVFMDCYMADMNGYGVTAEIRRREAGARRIPIVAMTAGAAEGGLARCLAAGMDGYITKSGGVAALSQALVEFGLPIKAEVLQEMVELFDGHGPRALGDFMDLYRSTGERCLRDLGAALAASDAAALELAAHSLRGVSGNIGARRLEGLCARVQDQSKAMDFEVLRPAVAAVSWEFERVVRTFDAFLGRPAGCSPRA